MIAQIVLVLSLTAAVVVGFVVYTLKNLLLVSNPSEVLILSGGTHQVEGRTVGYRSIRGGRAVRIPLLERVDRMDLTNIPVEIAVRGAYSKGGIPLNVQGIAHVKLPGEEPRLANAVERFWAVRVKRSLRLRAKRLKETCAVCWLSSRPNR
ncbi:MAG: hypothetical protein IPK82_05010 [Polyangiaceae bacterium]|nr:hypothetical protein [Polyangiaceae bacterium]